MTQMATRRTTSLMMRDDGDELTVNAEDEGTERSMPSDVKERRTLADIIMEKLKEKESADAAKESENREDEYGGLSPQVVEVYTSVGKLLSRYRAGKLPKAFKIIRRYATGRKSCT